MLSKKFEGCMVGALLGDCLGAPYEYKFVGNTMSQLQFYFDELEGALYKTVPLFKYTDDTAMTKSVAQSLIQHNSFQAHDMAERFMKEYFNEPYRRYGKNVRQVFYKWNNLNLEDIWAPAIEQFLGHGSYGNGGAMRISPVPLFSFNNYKNMIEITIQSTKLTHTHSIGVNGAILQAIAIFLAVKCNPEVPFSTADYMKELTNKMAEVENKTKRPVGGNISYGSQLGKVQKLLDMKDDVVSEVVVDLLGNNVSAIWSVPTAIYCFLRAQEPISDIKTENPFRRTIQYAISLGGDTDTIASMAGAIAGGYYGIDVVNKNFERVAEGCNMIYSLANQLYKNVSA